jgi:hypothetical protein
MLDEGKAVLAAAAQHQIFFNLAQKILVVAGSEAGAVPIRPLNVTLDHKALDGLDQQIVVKRMLINVAISAGNQRASAL